MFNKNLAYEASAGSGKTFNLVARYLTLLFMGASPSKILTLTFTNKAANEMSERIAQSLINMGDEIELVSKQSGLSKKEIFSMQKQVLDRFLSADTKIMTIDKFFTTIVRKFSLYLGILPTFTTLSAQHEQKLLEEFLQEVEHSYQYDDLLELSLFTQKRVGDIFSLLRELYIKKAELGDILKTKVIFTNRYADKAFDAFLVIKKMVLECKKASSTVKNAVNVQTFEELLKKPWIFKDTLDYSTFKKCYQKVMDEQLSTIQENISEHMRMKEQYFLSSLYGLLQTFAQSKQNLAHDSLEMSFDDVAIFAYDLLHSRIDSDFLYFRLDAKIEHILLDEFQDTSILQYKILRPLVQEIISGDGVHENGSFFFVGDTKQSIYRFRGGVSELFDYVCRENHVVKENLSVNYRSKQAIVSFVNDAFKDKITNYVSQHSCDNNNDGYVEVLKSQEILDDLYASAKMLLDLGADMNDIAVLCATNDDGLQIARMFEEHDIKVVTQTTSKLINQPIVQAVVQYLHYQYFKEDIYRYSFFALIGKEVESIRFVDLHNLSLLRIIEDVIVKFNLFDGTQNLLSFLEILGSYKDVEEFLFTYMQDDTTAPASSLDGIRVLTVHKSKGLEFEHVIVTDRFKRPPVSRNLLIYEYSGITLKNVYLRNKGREDIDKAYALALQKDQNLVTRDKINALYVAFTRAKRNLVIIKKDEHSIFDVLDLHVAKYGDLHVEPNNKSSKADYKVFDYKSLRYGLQEQVLSQAKQKEDDLQAVYFGLAMHYCLEMMSVFSAEAVLPAFYAMQNRYGAILNDYELEDIKRRVSMLVKSNEFLSLAKGICFKEQGMLIGTELRFIDLLVQKDDGSFNVIDYKSSSNISSSHISQVQGYISAVQEITAKKVYGYLCYVQNDKVEIKKVKM